MEKGEFEVPMNYIIFLQNAWSPFYAGGVWPRASWLRSLAKSKTGKKVSIITDDLNRCENTTPIVGDTASSKVPPDQKYMQEIIDRRKPDLIVAAGAQAIEAVDRIWQGAAIYVPHPACRWLPDDLYIVANRLIIALKPGEVVRVKIWQAKGEPIAVTDLVQK